MSTRHIPTLIRLIQERGYTVTTFRETDGVYEIALEGVDQATADAVLAEVLALPITPQEVVFVNNLGLTNGAAIATMLVARRGRNRAPQWALDVIDAFIDALPDSVPTERPDDDDD